MKHTIKAFLAALLLLIPSYSFSTVQRIQFEQLYETSSEDGETRALFFDAVSFDKTTFIGANQFYLGAGATGQGDSTLVRAEITQNAICDSEITLVKLARQNVFINQMVENPGPSVPNPFYDAKITQLSHFGPFPILTFDDGGAESNQRIVLLDTKTTFLTVFDQGGIFGDHLKTNPDFLNDAGGNQTSGIVALHGGGRIFAAVAPNGGAGAFGGTDSGIAVLSKGVTSLEVCDAQTGAAGNLAAAVTEALFELSGGGITINPAAGVAKPVALHWDSSLGRLYVGVKVAKDNAPAVSATAVLIGRFSGKQLILEPVVGGFFSLATLNQIIGFNFGVTTNAASTIHNIKTMHTTTSKSYLIVNGGASASGDDVNDQIYALPLLKAALTGDGADVAKVGKIANKADTTALVGATAEMTLNTDDAALVGQGPLPNHPAANAIQDMYVVGNAVFVSIAGDRTAGEEAGIFQSQALFDEDGCIRSWTRWQRVMGSVDKVYGGGLDQQTGNYWYLTSVDQTTDDKNQVKVTQWGDGESRQGLLNGNAGDTSVGLASILDTQFPIDKAGVHQLFDFQTTTPGFSQNNFAMMVATGFGKVALIESGRSAAGLLTPNKGDFSVNLGQNIGNAGTAGIVQPFSGEPLTSLGPICAAEISRIIPEALESDNQGWLFVGGQNGVAVLSADNGDGWDATAGLNAGFASISGAFTFKKIGSFTGVKKLVADGDNLYVLTGKGLYRIAMVAGKFASTPVALDEALIATPLAVTGRSRDSFLDFIIVGMTGVLATTNGLFALNPGLDIKGIINTSNWTEAVTAQGRSIGPVSHIAFQADAAGTGGNIYATAADISLDVTSIYLFDIQPAGVMPVVTPSGRDYFVALGELRTAFSTDGALGFHTRSRHFGDINFLKLVPMDATPLTVRRSQQIIDLSDPSLTVKNVGLLVLNSASGARILPGDWGIKINE